MAEHTLEERIAALEQEVERLSRQLRPREPGRDDWKSTVGMFANDPIMKEILDEARKIREQDREQTRDQN
jgi:tetrahydromethanopterin S-methyltransferase subunit B